MTWLDYAIIGVVAVSALLGGWRGLAYEILSLLGWVAAYFVARMFSENLLPYVPIEAGPDALRYAVAFGILFLAVLMVSAILAWGLSRLIQFVGLGWLNGLLGALFGVIRGGLVVLSLAWVAGMTDIPKQPYWQHAKLTSFVQAGATAVKDWLPESMAERLHY